MLRRFCCLVLCLFLSALHAGGLQQRTVITDYARADNEIRDLFVFADKFRWLLSAQNGSHFLYQTNNDGASWTRTLLPAPIYGIQFLDSQIGWGLSRVENSGSSVTELWQTRDGGGSWRKLSTVWASDPSISYFVTGFVFVDQNHGWFVGSQTLGQTLAWRTTDGGHSFERVSNLWGRYNAAWHAFVDAAARVWILGIDAVTCYERDGTLVRTFSPDDVSLSVRSIAFTAGSAPSEGTVLIAGQAGVGFIFHISGPDGTLKRVETPPEMPSISDIHFLDDLHGCAVGSSEQVFCTNNAGQNWSYRSSLPLPKNDQADFFQRILMVSDKEMWVLRAGGFLYQTKDGGQSWRNVDLAVLAAQTE